MIANYYSEFLSYSDLSIAIPKKRFQRRSLTILHDSRRASLLAIDSESLFGSSRVATQPLQVISLRLSGSNQLVLLGHAQGRWNLNEACFCCGLAWLIYSRPSCNAHSPRMKGRSGKAKDARVWGFTKRERRVRVLGKIFFETLRQSVGQNCVKKVQCKISRQNIHNPLQRQPFLHSQENNPGFGMLQIIHSHCHYQQKTIISYDYYFMQPSKQVGLLHDANELLFVDFPVSVAVCLVDHLLKLLIGHSFSQLSGDSLQVLQ